MVLSVIKCNIFLGDSKCQRTSKSHYWFKICGDFIEWVDFVYWWSFSGGWSAINGANPSSLKHIWASPQKTVIYHYFLYFKGLNAASTVDFSLVELIILTVANPQDHIKFRLKMTEAVAVTTFCIYLLLIFTT